jgi:hypothetical protein
MPLACIRMAQRRHLDHAGEQVAKYTSDSSDFGADGPFFQIIRALTPPAIRTISPPLSAAQQAR